MRSKSEIEIETAASILRAMGDAIEQIERYWPVSKRGSNASREFERLKMQRTTALQCLLDAQSATS